MTHGYKVIRAYLLVGHDMIQFIDGRNTDLKHMHSLGLTKKIKCVRNQMRGSAATMCFLLGKFPDLSLS